MKNEKPKLKCENCPFNTGVQCHGHGEFWAECKALDIAYKTLKEINKEKGWVQYIEPWATVIGNNGECKFFEIWLKDNEQD